MKKSKLNMEIPEDEYIRLYDILKITGFSKKEWYRGVNAGIYPNPVKIGIYPMYKREDIIALLDKMETLIQQNNKNYPENIHVSKEKSTCTSSNLSQIVGGFGNMDTEKASYI